MSRPASARRAGLAALLLLLAACAVGPARLAETAPPSAGWTPIAVTARAAPLRAPSYASGAVRFRGGVALASYDPRFGGLSDLRLGEDRTEWLAVTDAGDLISGRLRLDASGRLIGVDQVRIRRLTDLNGQPISDKARGDAEGLAILPNGDVLVAFEREHRIWSYGRGGEARLPRPVPSPTTAFADNEGMEGLVGDGAGGWYVAGEGGGFWHCDPAGCVERAPADQGGSRGYRPTGLALDGQGAGLLQLERFFVPPIDTRVRVRRLDRDGRATQELIALRLPATVDNFEGIATTLNPDGSVRVYLLSDDNFSGRQRTLLLAFDIEM